jgi:VanZ family protein
MTKPTTAAMSLFRPFHRPRIWFALWLALIAAVITGSLLPADELPEPVFAGVDKLQHFLGYAALSGYAVMLFERARAHAIAALAMVLLGIAIEFAQGAITGSRRADSIDAFANALGVIAGWLVRYTRLQRLVQGLDTRMARSLG